MQENFHTVQNMTTQNVVQGCGDSDADFMNEIDNLALKYINRWDQIKGQRPLK